MNYCVTYFIKMFLFNLIYLKCPILDQKIYSIENFTVKGKCEINPLHYVELIPN